MRTTAVGSGRVDAAAGASEEADALRGPATAESSVRVDGKELKKQTAPTGNLGRQGKDGLDELPKDALAREARGSV